MGLRHNINELPEGFELPKEYEGKTPVIVEHGMVDEGSNEVVYKALCKGGTFVDIPESKLVEKPKADKKK